MNYRLAVTYAAAGNTAVEGGLDVLQAEQGLHAFGRDLFTLEGAGVKRIVIEAELPDEGKIPRPVERPTDPSEAVQVMMPQAFIAQLEQLTDFYLAGPVLFAEDDLPTYTLERRS